MSGNFVQRGEAAIFRKHARAEAAVLSGADLVLELPLPWSVSSAERFAFGAVSLLNSLGICTHLSFGSECGRIDTLKLAAECVLSPETSEMIKAKLKSGVSYATARTQAVSQLIGGASSALEKPNDTLGVEYLKALFRLESRMKPIAIQRFGAGHDEITADGFASASHLRNLLRRGEMPWSHIPDPAAKIFLNEVSSGRGPVFVESCESAVIARLRTMSDVEYSLLPDATEGLALRFARAARTESDMQSVLTAAKTKRYALSRLRRMLTAAYLGVKAEDSDGIPPYARVLAANGPGRRILDRISEVRQIPVLTKPASVKNLEARAQRTFEKEAHATDLYVLAYPNVSERRGGQEWRTSPVMI